MKRTLLLSPLLVLTFILMACTPKTSEPEQLPPAENNPPITETLPEQEEATLPEKEALNPEKDDDDSLPLVEINLPPMKVVGNDDNSEDAVLTPGLKLDLIVPTVEEIEVKIPTPKPSF